MRLLLLYTLTCCYTAYTNASYQVWVSYRPHSRRSRVWSTLFLYRKAADNRDWLVAFATRDIRLTPPVSITLQTEKKNRGCALYLYFFCVIGQPRLIAPLSCLFTPLIVKNYIVILKKHFVLILQHLNVSIYIRTFNMMHGLTTYKNTIQW